jgi:hypothetical protein
MYVSVLIGVGCGFAVLLMEAFIIERLYAEKKPSPTSKLDQSKNRTRECIVEGETEVEGTVEQIKDRLEQSLRLFSLSGHAQRMERAGDTITFRPGSINFPEEISYTVSRGWSKPVKVSYRMNFIRQKMRFKKISLALLLLVSAPVATAIPWLVSYVVTTLPSQKIQLVQLVHLWHIWWPFFPYIIYRKSKNLSKTFFEGILSI